MRIEHSLEAIEKRLQYLEGKEAEREAEKQRWIKEASDRRITISDGSVTTSHLAHTDRSVKTHSHS